MKQVLANVESMSRYALLALFVCSSALAQFDATVLGTVKDASGSVVNNSEVTLSNLANGTQQGSVTNANGEFQFLNVRLGDYTLKAEAPGL